MKTRAIVFPVLPFVLILLLVEVLSQKGILPLFLFPAPSLVFRSIKDESGVYQKAFFETGLASLSGLLLSIAFGLTSALLLSFSKLLKSMFYPYAIFFQTVPIIAIAPLLVIWLGYGLPTVVASAFIVSVFPVIANSVEGLESTDAALLNLFKMMGASRLQTLFRLRLPFALPSILAGFKIAAGLSVIGAIVGEFIAGSGLGGLVDEARNQQRLDRVFGAVFLAAVLGIVFFSLITILTRVLLKHWKETKTNE